MNPYDDAEQRPAVRYEELEVHNYPPDDWRPIERTRYILKPGGIILIAVVLIVIIATVLILTAPRVATAASSPGERRPLPEALFRDVLPDTATDVSGKASWYCGPNSRCTRGYPAGGYYAAAGQALRTGDWRGRSVRVCASEAGPRCITVRLIDWCACGNGKVIDLYHAAFSALAPPRLGLIRVTVTTVGARVVRATVPPTDTGG